MSISVFERNGVVYLKGKGVQTTRWAHSQSAAQVDGAGERGDAPKALFHQDRHDACRVNQALHPLSREAASAGGRGGGGGPGLGTQSSTVRHAALRICPLLRHATAASVVWAKPIEGGGERHRKHTGASPEHLLSAIRGAPVRLRWGSGEATEMERRGYGGFSARPERARPFRRKHWWTAVGRVTVLSYNTYVDDTGSSLFPVEWCGRKAPLGASCL